MPLEDSAVVTNAETARLYTGMSPSTVKAYQEGGDIFGISVPTDGMEVASRQPPMRADGTTSSKADTPLCVSRDPMPGT